MDIKKFQEKFWSKIDYNTNIPADKYYIVRCDGRCFRKLTENIHKPFESKFKEIMYSTLRDVFEKFHADLGYSHSDEISLVFRKKDGLSQHIFGGNPIKIISLIAAYISVRFIFHATNLIPGWITDPHSHFDGRIGYITSDIEDIYEYFSWRTCDCFRNCIFGYAQTLKSNKELISVKIKEMLVMLDDSINDGTKFIDRIPHDEKYGIFIEKETYIYTILKDSHKGPIRISTKRHRIMRREWRIKELRENFV